MDYSQRQLSSTESSSGFGLLTQISSNVLLFTLIFGMSATVDVKRIKEQLRNCRALTTGLIMQFLIMPLLGFTAVKALRQYGLTAPMGITLLIVTSSPGGSYSNWWCSLFNADLALSVAMTALSTLISIAALPANLLLYSHLAYGYDSDQEQHILHSVNFPKLIISLGIVIGAIICGLYASYRISSSKFNRLANAFGSISGILLVLLSAVFSSAGDTDAKPWNQNWSFYIGVGFPCIIGLALANIAAKFANLKKPEIVTLSVECSYQNTGIATTAVLAMFNDPEKIAQAMAVPLFYGLIEMGVLGLYCLVAWKLGWTKAPKEEKFCLVVTKTYEVEDSDEDDITALQDSVDQVHQNRKDSPRDRLDTLESDSTGVVTLSLSDLSTSERLKQSRPHPQWAGSDDVEMQTVFQTIKEGSEDAIDVSEHGLRKEGIFADQKNAI